MAYYRVYSATAKIKTDPSGAGRELWTLNRKVKGFARRVHAEMHLPADLEQLEGAFTLVTDVMRASECPDTGAEHVTFKN